MRVAEAPKQDWRAEKHRRDQAKWEEIKGDPAIRFGEWGWKTRLGLLLNISPNKVEKWLARVTNGSLA